MHQTFVTPSLTIRRLIPRAVTVPLDPPLQTAVGTIANAPLVLLDLETEEGITGSAYIFAYTSSAQKPLVELLQNYDALIQGQTVAPFALEQTLRGRFRLLGIQGLVGMAMAAVDIAAWDVLAKAVGLPLVRYLGGTARKIQSYASLRCFKPMDVLHEAESMATQGFTAYKLKTGHGDLASEIALIKDLRRAVGEKTQVMIDYNQALSVPEAMKRAAAFEPLELTWMEEPVAHDDFAGHATIAAATITPIQFGENWWGTHDMAKSLTMQASDCGMPDSIKIGGVSGWQRASALAEAAAMPISSHLFIEVSAHLLSVTPTAHYLEYLDMAGPLLQQPLTIEDGYALPSERPGNGIQWNEKAVQQFLS